MCSDISHHPPVRSAPRYAPAQVAVPDGCDEMVVDVYRMINNKVPVFSPGCRVWGPELSVHIVFLMARDALSFLFSKPPSRASLPSSPSGQIVIRSSVR